jgi:protein NrfD
MALGGMGLFLLEAGAGTALLLLFFPSAELGRGFFALHGALALAFVVLAGIIRPAGLSLPLAALAAALLALYAVATYADRVRAARALLAPAAVVGLVCLWRVALEAPRPHGDAWTAAGAILGGLFLGAVLLTMNLGHWYLVSRSLPFHLLARGATLFAVLAAARAGLLAAAIAMGGSRQGLASLLSLERDALFFLFRVLWGIVGPLALSYFIWKTADMRSNQAATGLLYVALVFVLIGELLSSYLTVATGFPA